MFIFISVCIAIEMKALAMVTFCDTLLLLPKGKIYFLKSSQGVDVYPSSKIYGLRSFGLTNTVASGTPLVERRIIDDDQFPSS